MSRRAWLVGLASVLVIAAVVVAVSLDRADDDEAAADPVAGFLAAYERSRTATFVVEQRFTRTAPDGAELAYDRRLAQRPPDDRILVGGGAGEGRLDGRVVRCSTSPDGTSGCIEGPPAGPYAEEVAAEVATLRSLVEGDGAAYEVRAGEPGCWSLHLRVQIEAPPYGEVAGFCFDEATGAPTRLEVRREEAIDVIEATAIRATVTAEDLRPGDLGDLPSPDQD